MITYKEACKKVGYDSSLPMPEIIHVWHAYKDGHVRSYSSKDQAMKFSTNVESTTANRAEIASFWESQHSLEHKAFSVWFDALRKEYSYLPTAVFDLCYSKAYEDGHSSGYDEVASRMIEYADFATALSTAIVKSMEPTVRVLNY